MKGAVDLAQIVELVQLRPKTIVFIDDNHGNRVEAAHMVPGLEVWDDRRITEILTSTLFSGKDDGKLSRLAQYKILEQKEREKQSFESNVDGFLKSSNIIVEMDYNVDQHIARAVELINRTNQLNFTKLRLAG